MYIILILSNACQATAWPPQSWVKDVYWASKITSFIFSIQQFTLIPGYLIFFFGGVAFAYLYQRFIKRKNITTGILFAVLFAMTVVAGLVVMPITGVTHPLVQSGVIPNPGWFGLGFGPKAGLFTFLGHVVYGAVLGALSKNT
jgi:intracellular septation protein A